MLSMKVVIMLLDHYPIVLILWTWHYSLQEEQTRFFFWSVFAKWSFYILIYFIMNLDLMNPYPAYWCTTQPLIKQSSSNFFEKRMMKEKDRQICFWYVFYNGEKNASEIFSIEKQRNILFHYFQIYSKFNGYLSNITLLMFSITTTKYKRLIIIAFILFNKKNDFVKLRKMEILDHFLKKKNRVPCDV